MSALEASLELQLRALKVQPPQREYHFAAHHVGLGPGLRKRLADADLKNWRFDFAWPDHRFACEVEGGTWIGGRHSRGKGFQEDCLKYHHAMRLGWTVYRCDSSLVSNGRAAQLVAALITKPNVSGISEIQQEATA